MNCLELVGFQAVPQELLRHGRVQTLHVVACADRVVQLWRGSQVVYEREGVVFGNQAQLLGVIYRHVQRCLWIYSDGRALGVEKVTLENVSKGMATYVTGYEGTGAQIAILQRVGHALDLTSTVPMSTFRGPVEAVLGIDAGIQALPGHVVAAGGLALGVTQVQPGVLQPLETDLVGSLVLGQAGKYTGVGWYAYTQASGYYLDSRAVVHVHDPLVFIEPANQQIRE